MINYLRIKINEWDKYQEASVVKTDRVYISLLLTLSSFSNRLIGQGEMINLGYVRETLLVFLQLEKRTPSIYSVLSQKSYRNTNILVYMYSIFSPNEGEIPSHILLRNTYSKRPLKPSN